MLWRGYASLYFSPNGLVTFNRALANLLIGYATALPGHLKHSSRTFSAWWCEFHSAKPDTPWEGEGSNTSHWSRIPFTDTFPCKLIPLVVGHPNSNPTNLDSGHENREGWPRPSEQFHNTLQTTTEVTQKPHEWHNQVRPVSFCLGATMHVDWRSTVQEVIKQLRVHRYTHNYSGLITFD